MINISVAMAAYNGERFLRYQMDSIINQLGDNDELVVSYDESQDKTLEILSEYSKREEKVRIVMDPGKGVFSNFENAISACRGEYIFISDQDDIWLPDKIEHIRRIFEEENADMVIHNGVHVNTSGEIISKDFFSMYGIRNNLLINFLKPRYSGCCTAFNRKMKDLIIPIPRDAGAYDHWIGMVGECFGKLVFDESVLIHHRIHENNVTVERRNLKKVLRSRYGVAKALVKRKSR